MKRIELTLLRANNLARALNDGQYQRLIRIIEGCLAGGSALHVTISEDGKAAVYVVN